MRKKKRINEGMYKQAQADLAEAERHSEDIIARLQSELTEVRQSIDPMKLEATMNKSSSSGATSAEGTCLAAGLRDAC